MSGPNASITYSTPACFTFFPTRTAFATCAGSIPSSIPRGRLFLLCFSDATPGTEGPRRVSQSELRHAFADGWEIESLEPVRLEIRPDYRQGAFSGEDPRGWFLIAHRLA